MKSKWKILGIAGLCVIILVIAVAAAGGSSEEVTYRETTVQQGNLIVGISESGSVDVGTVDQVFELDMSALQRVDTNSSSSSTSSTAGAAGGFSGAGGAMGGGNTAGGGGMDMFSQLFSMAGSDNVSGSGTDSSLTVSNVCVSVGQQVSVGDVLYELEEESVAELQEQLQSNVEKAKADLDAVYADQILSKQTAQYTYDTSVAYGDYATVEYNTSLQDLQDNVTAAQKTLEQAKASLSDYEAQLAETTASYEDAVQILKNCEWSRDTTDKSEDTYNYVTYFQMAQTAQSTVDTLEQKKERLEENVEQATQNVDTAQQSYNKALRNLEQGKLTAKETLSLRQLAYNTAQETYDIAIAYLEEDASAQETIYQEAEEKWEEYSSHISGNSVCSQYDGVITSVDLAEGDSIYTNSVLVTLYDTEDVTMTVTVDEDDMTDIAKGTLANITFTAYPDTVFQAAVTEISDASTDSSGNVTYDVTVTLQGDVSSLFQGMTGDITFITKESENVLYVSNRAIIREGTKSYVKIKNGNGKIEKKEITTGFSDGVNVEIVEGLSEGDIVLIESKVSET